MSDGHCFISYSTADGIEFAKKLILDLEGVEPYIPAWYDKRDIPAGSNWDDEIVEAIRSCKCMLFVMSDDSTKPSSDCKKEILFALKYKKPIIPLLIQKKAEPIFMIATREWIDFADFNAGMGKLRKYIHELNLPVGQLRLLKERLSDANHDLRRTTGEEENRIKAEIAELETQIRVQEKIAQNPKAAEEQTQKNIEAGLERERQPEKPVASKTSTKFINPPPGVAPNYFQDHYDETKQIVDFLNNDSQRLMTIVGRGGVGKTAMVCRLLKGLEGGELPDGLGNMRVEGIVYLSESGSHRVNFVNIFYDLCKLLPSETSQELDAVYKNPQGSTESKMRALLEKFEGGRVVLLLDNFEPLVDTETFTIRDAELDEALRAFLNGTHTAVNIVLTTRVAPRTLNLTQPGRQRALTLDEGLESPYAENILREMDSDGRMGLKSASADLLSRARERTRGYPRALEALFAILASDRYTTLEELLAMTTPENVVEALVGEAFNRLDTNAQKVMQALAVYNRPVSPAAVDYLLAPHIPAMDSAPILQRLANMHFARKESGRFYLHPMDREFAFGLVPEKDSNTKDTKDSKEEQRKLLQSFFSKRQPTFTNYHLLFTKHELTLRAADYFAQARKPRAEWKKLDDLAAQLAEFDLRCAAGDYDSAASVLRDFDADYLLLWGHYHLTIRLHKQLLGNVNDLYLKLTTIWLLGLAFQEIGEFQNAISYHNQTLFFAREQQNKTGEAAALGNLGTIYKQLGDARKAIEFFEQVLILAKENGDRRYEEKTLGSLGSVYVELGDIRKSTEFYEQALAISNEIENLQDQGIDLSNLANNYSIVGEYDKSIYYYEQALENAREIGNKYGESKRLAGLAGVLIEKGDLQNAIKNLQESLRIGQEISSPEVCSGSGSSLAEAYLFQNDLVNARTTIETALQYDVPEYNHDATALHGIIALRQGDASAAYKSFTRAIAQADEILAKTPEYYSALDAKGLSICGLMVCDLRLKNDDGRRTMDDGQSSMVNRQRAIETFKKARKIAPHAGVVKSVLRLFDELVKCDEEGILKDVRKAAEGVE